MRHFLRGRTCLNLHIQYHSLQHRFSHESGRSIRHWGSDFSMHIINLVIFWIRGQNHWKRELIQGLKSKALPKPIVYTAFIGNVTLFWFYTAFPSFSSICLHILLMIPSSDAIVRNVTVNIYRIQYLQKKCQICRIQC